MSETREHIVDPCQAALDSVRDEPGRTALLEAIILGDGGATHTEILRLLLTAGADPRIADADGVRPLERASERG